jgi:hypothetical protein
MVDSRDIATRLRKPSSVAAADYRRMCIAVFAARLVGEATYAAQAVRGLLNRLSGGDDRAEIALLAEASSDIAGPISTSDSRTVSSFYETMLAAQSELGSSWGILRGEEPLPASRTEWEDVGQFLDAELPRPQIPEAAERDALLTLLCDGRPINARPSVLPSDFERQLEAVNDADGLYNLLEVADERACSLSTILGVGWRYKIVRTYTLCSELMSGEGSWKSALDTLAAHVLERCGLLQQSIEASYVQQVFSRWRDI